MLLNEQTTIVCHRAANNVDSNCNSCALYLKRHTPAALVIKKTKVNATGANATAGGANMTNATAGGAN